MKLDLKSAALAWAAFVAPAAAQTTTQDQAGYAQVADVDVTAVGTIKILMTATDHAKAKAAFENIGSVYDELKMATPGFLFSRTVYQNAAPAVFDENLRDMARVFVATPGEKALHATIEDADTLSGRNVQLDCRMPKADTVICKL